MERILVALSGGVDSAVAALLLQEAGHDVECAYMKNWINEENILGDCPWQQDIEDASAVAQHLGIPFRVINFMRDYRERVVNYLVEGYRTGRTPNPDVMCNREMKFGVLLDYAHDHGFAAVATGHYVIRQVAADGAPTLHEGRDPNKDQSYFLAMLRPQQVAAARFPIGHLTKPEVRQKARAAGLPNAEKKDSQGICFIGEVRINDFLEKFIEDDPGEIVNPAGEVLGTHRGLHRYTIGQRKGIGIPSNTDFAHYVVIAKDLPNNRLIVAFDSPDTTGLYHTKVRIHSIQWLHHTISTPCQLLAKPRYRDPSVPIDFIPAADGLAEIHFAEPQRALAPGQVCALYHGSQLLGGGVYIQPGVG